MGKKKSLFTVKECTAQAFRQMPDNFSGIQLIQMTRTLLARPSCTDGNIMRRMRELRNENPKVYGYRCIDLENSRYKKQSLNPA